MSLVSSKQARRTRRWFGALLFAAILGHGGGAAANGRFPVAQFLTVGPGDRSSTFALATTFGIVSSSDGGKTWQFTCEEGVGYDPRTSWDNALAITSTNALVVGLPTGLTIAPQRSCTFVPPPNLPFVSALDLAIEPGSGRLVAAVTTPVRATGVAISDDNGATWRMGWTLADFFIMNVDIAPGHPERVYVSGTLNTDGQNRLPTLFRSDDGGDTFVEMNGDFQDSGYVYLTAVDPTDPNVIYLRGDLPTNGTRLLRSDDAGKTFRSLIETANPMTGFAMAPDGRQLWVGSPEAGSQNGIFRSTDGGQNWTQVASGYTTFCLRYQAGILYMCAAGIADGFAVGASADGGKSFTPLLVWSDMIGPQGCPGTSPGRTQCEAGWPDLQSTLIPDAGCQFDGATCPTMKPPATDATPAQPDAGAAPALDASGGTCSCRLGAPGRRNSGSSLVAGLLIIGAGLARHRRPKS